MKSLKIPKGVRRVLFRTLNTDRYRCFSHNLLDPLYILREISDLILIHFRKLMKKKEFDSSYTGFTTDGAHWLVKNTAIQLIGNPTHTYILYS